MAIPRSELEHWRAAEAEYADRDLEQYGPGEVEADPDHERLVAEAVLLEQYCPTILAEMDAKLRPLAGSPALLGPTVNTMTFGEMAAYRMGQDSAHLWLRSLIEQSKRPPEMPAIQEDVNDG